MNLYLFIGIIFILTFIIGRYLEKIRVPWIFAALLIGAGLAIYNPFFDISNSDSFQLLANLGMYFLLFLVGFELNLNQFKKKSRFILKSTIIIIFFEGIVGTMLVHSLFHYSWLISFIAGLSFATVGEAILVPILDEFKLINTLLGQSIIGIGTADDFIEILLLIAVSFLVSSQAQSSNGIILLSLILLLILTVSFKWFTKKRERFRFASIESLFLFILFVFFLFIGLGYFAHAEPLAAILAGISIRSFLPKDRLKFVENEITSLAYGFFAPLFFVVIGAELNIHYLISYPLLVILVVVVSNLAKLFGSILVGRKELGMRGSILLGIGLSVRFSTSIIIIKFLYDNHLIRFDLFSVIVASSIVFKFIIPLLFSNLVVQWKFAKNRS